MSVVIIRPVLALVVTPDEAIETHHLPKGFRFRIRADYDSADGRDWLALPEGGVLAVPASAWHCERFWGE